MIDLGPFKPKFNLFQTAVEPAVDVMVDVTTSQLAARFKTDSRATIDMATLTRHVKDIADRGLPIDLTADPCTFTIERLTDFRIAVSGYTGNLRATLNVTPHGCPLNNGDVTVEIRFIPTATKTDLTMKVVQTKPTVPWWWGTLGAVLGTKPETLIDKHIREYVGTISLKLPTVDGVHAAFQGASLETRGAAIVFRVRADAVVERRAIVDFLRGLEQVKNLSYTYP